MCSYSMVHDWAQKLPQQIWTQGLVSEYQQIIAALKVIDAKLSLPDCDPNKGEFLIAIEKRLAAIEKAVKPKKVAKPKAKSAASSRKGR